MNDHIIGIDPFTDDVPNEFQPPTSWAPYLRKLGYAPVPVEANAKFSRMLDTKYHDGLPDHVFKDIRFENFPALGTLTGNSCNFDGDMGLVVIDVDCGVDKDGVVLKDGAVKLHELETAFNGGREFETVKVITPSGGVHYHFKCPRDTMPGCSSPWKDIDVKGFGGFVMLPPSPAVPPKAGDAKVNRHSAYSYAVDPVAENLKAIPEGMLAALLAGGGPAAKIPPRVTSRAATDTPTQTTDLFGALIDGRDKHMADVAFAVVNNLFRDCPIRPAENQWEAVVKDAYLTYLQHPVKTRIQGVENEVGLEQENRGLSAMRAKVTRHLKNWESIGISAREKPRTDATTKAANLSQGQSRAATVSAEVGNEKGERFKNLDGMHAKKPLSYRIDGLVIEHGVGVIAGPSGHYKGFLEVHFGLSIALGRPIHGRKVKPGKVCFVLYEGAPGFAMRVEGWIKSHNLNTAENRAKILKNVLFVEGGGSLVELTDKQEVADFTTDLQAEGITTVFFDTFGKAADANPNLAEEVRPVFKTMARLADAIDGVVIAIDHFGKDVTKGVTGTHAKKADADFNLHVSRHGDKKVKLFVDKVKDGEDGFSLYFDIDKVTAEIADASTGELRKAATLALQDDTIFKPKTNQVEALCEILRGYPDGIKAKELKLIFTERLDTSDATFRSNKRRALEDNRITQDQFDMIRLADAEE